MHFRRALVAGIFVGGFYSSAFAVQVPVNATGYNQDWVVSATDTFPAGITGTLDNGVGATSGNTWYGQGYNTGAPTTGLPIGPTVSASDPNTTFALQPFGTPAGNVNNTLVIDPSNTTGTLTLNTPTRYNTLSFFGSTGNGNNTANYTLHFSDNSTQTGTVSFPDWFGNSPVAVNASGRVNDGGFDNVGSNNPNIYQENVTFTDPGFNLTSVDFSLATGSGHSAIMGLSGTEVGPTPEPASMGLLAMGGLGLLARRRRAQSC